MLSWIFRALRLGGVLTSPQAAPSGLQMTPPSHSGTENPRKPGSPDFILILITGLADGAQWSTVINTIVINIYCSQHMVVNMKWLTV